MTTSTSNSAFDHSTDIAARAWIDGMHTIMSAAGLLQTSDTGQINTATYTKSGSTNTTNAYSIWKLPDSSLFFKFAYGNGSATSVPRVDLQVGEGSNGAGTLTGQLSTNQIITSGTAISSTTNLFPSFCCVTNDFWGLAFKGGGQVNGYFAISCAVYKTVDSSGAVTSLGYVVANMTVGAAFGLSTFQSVRRIATAATYTATNSFCLVPGYTTSAPDSSLDANNLIQVYVHWGHFPEPIPLLHTITVRSTEIPFLSKFNVAVIGSTQHTYLMIGDWSNSGNSVGGTNGFWRPAMLWE